MSAVVQTGVSRRFRLRSAMSQIRRSRSPGGRAPRGNAREVAATCRRQGGADNPFAVVMGATDHSQRQRSNPNHDNSPAPSLSNAMGQDWGKVLTKKNNFETISRTGRPEY